MYCCDGNGAKPVLSGTPSSCAQEAAALNALAQANAAQAIRLTARIDRSPLDAFDPAVVQTQCFIDVPLTTAFLAPFTQINAAIMTTGV
jgi:hypothetical protein